MGIRIFICFIVLIASSKVFAQSVYNDSLADKGMTVNKMIGRERLLVNKRYFYTNSYFIPIQNQKNEYILFQLEKSKRCRICIYIKFYIFNTCIKEGDIMEVTFLDGYKQILKNSYPINCEGIIVIELSKKKLKKMLQQPVKKMTIFTFQKDFEFYISSKMGMQILDDLNFLNTAKFKNKLKIQ